MFTKRVLLLIKREHF